MHDRRERMRPRCTHRHTRIERDNANVNGNAANTTDPTNTAATGDGAASWFAWASVMGATTTMVIGVMVFPETPAAVGVGAGHGGGVRRWHNSRPPAAGRRYRVAVSRHQASHTRPHTSGSRRSRVPCSSSWCRIHLCRGGQGAMKKAPTACPCCGDQRHPPGHGTCWE